MIAGNEARFRSRWGGLFAEPVEGAVEAAVEDFARCVAVVRDLLAVEDVVERCVAQVDEGACGLTVLLAVGWGDDTGGAEDVVGVLRVRKVDGVGRSEVATELVGNWKRRTVAEASGARVEETGHEAVVVFVEIAEHEQVCGRAVVAGCRDRLDGAVGFDGFAESTGVIGACLVMDGDDDRIVGGAGDVDFDHERVTGEFLSTSLAAIDLRGAGDRVDAGDGEVLVGVEAAAIVRLGDKIVVGGGEVWEAEICEQVSQVEEIASAGDLLEGDDIRLDPFDQCAQGLEFWGVACADAVEGVDRREADRGAAGGALDVLD